MEKIMSEPKPPPLPKPRKTDGNVQSIPNFPKRGPDEKFCESCGAIMKINMLACPNCGKKKETSDSTPGCAIAAIALGVMFILIMVIGMIAAIAIPSFIAHKNKAYQTAVKNELSIFLTAEDEYYQKNGKYTANIEELVYTPANPLVSITVRSADEECFQASGTMAEMHDEIWIDCLGNEEVVPKGSIPGEEEAIEDIPDDVSPVSGEIDL